MARMTTAEAARHREACALIALDRELTPPEREFVLENLQEAQTPTHGLDGAYFTPAVLANDLSIEVDGARVLDLCAGIGRLAFHNRDLMRRWNGQAPRELVCVEKNPDYLAAGRKILPEARWVLADVFDLPELDLGKFDCVISNPPFGATPRDGRCGPRYAGRRFEYHVIDLASDLAPYGVFIVPQISAPFRYSGEPYYRVERDGECRRFEAATGIALESNCGIDTTACQGDWRGVAPRVEIVLADFTNVKRPVPQVEPVTNVRTADDRHREMVNRSRSKAGLAPLALFDLLDN